MAPRRARAEWRVAGVAAAAALLLSLCTGAGPMKDAVEDRYVPVPLDQQHLTEGLLAERMRVNLEQRLLKVDESAILDGFVHRPGKQAWIGEHAGKFLDAAARAWAYSHDQRLKALMDRVAVALIAAQGADGYLGTYADDQRWTAWDVWVHKYDLLGLVAYYDVTGDQRALDACRRIGDLLCSTFGDAPGQRDLSKSGEHVGMAATSVLEPMCYLYRHTGQQKYLEFCLYITRNIEQHSKVISSLSSGRGVDQTANGKAYEMMSNLVGLVELYRLTGRREFLVPAEKAWEDIAAHHLYLTGTVSSKEYFRPAGELPGGEKDDVGEGCATVTWLQLNLSLLKLTGEAKYADQIERTVYNQLLAAQHPQTGDICYFTPMMGKKPYGHEINCCLSSEPRGIARIPECTWATSAGDACLALYAPGTARLVVTGLDDGQPMQLQVKCDTDFPASGRVTLSFQRSRPGRFALKLRQPSWCDRISTPDRPILGRPGEWARLEVPANVDRLTFDLGMPMRVAPGGRSYPDAVALVRGPEVLSLDAATGTLHPFIEVPEARVWIPVKSQAAAAGK